MFVLVHQRSVIKHSLCDITHPSGLLLQICRMPANVLYQEHLRSIFPITPEWLTSGLLHITYVWILSMTHYLVYVLTQSSLHVTNYHGVSVNRRGTDEST